MQASSNANGTSKTMTENSYKSAGVDIDAGNELVKALSPLANSTKRSGSLGGLGGFGALFDLKATGYEDPILIACTDGVGTKIKIAIETGLHDTIGIDLVAMSVNDLVVQGGEPLFFLDYFATSKLKKQVAESVVAGVAEGCKMAGCALVGGETAEMPGMYDDDDYDLAGFAIGAVERDEVLTGQEITDGDVVLGLPSSGLHSNGFSLVRQIVKERDYDWEEPAPFAYRQSLGEALLTPTRIYVKPVLEAIRTIGVRGVAHITGGGLYENVPRILPPGLGVDLDAKSWKVPPVFQWLASYGKVAPQEMARVFNCGVGMAVICREEDVRYLTDIFSNHNLEAQRIGVVVPRLDEEPKVMIDHLDTAFGA